MDLSSGLFPPAWLWLGHALIWPALGTALYLTLWPESRKSIPLIRIWPSACVALLCAWQLKAGVYPGLSLHLLGATLLTLMFGWRLALIGVSMVVAAISYQRNLGWLSFGMNVLVMVIVPVAISQLVSVFAQRLLPLNVFVYIFVSGFSGAALAVTTVGLVSAGLLLCASVYPLEHLLTHYLGFYPLLIFPEAFVTGALLSLFVVYRPQWVVTFDDERYLARR